MGQKIKGGKYCRQCNKPVLAVRNTHMIRNPASLATVVATEGFSLLAFKRTKYVCSTCGGPVK